MTPDAATRMAVSVGVTTAAIGAGLLAAPERAGAPFGIEDTRLLRAFGAADLVLVPGLLAGRPRWGWMAGRAGLNLVMAARLAREPGPQARAIAAALVAVTVVDGRAARTLHRAGA